MRLALVLLLPLAGCVQDATLIEINPDGSGIVAIIRTTNTALAKLAEQQDNRPASDTTEGDKEVRKAGGTFSENDARALVAQMGEDVVFVGSEPFKNGQFEGLKAVYAFKDISKLTVPAPFSNFKGTGQTGEPASEPQGLRFKWARRANGNAVLTAVFNAEKTGPNWTKKDQGKPEKMMETMRLLPGLCCGIVVKPTTPVVNTNAPARNGELISLLELDLDQIVKDKSGLKKFVESQYKSMTLVERAKFLKNISGIRLPASPEIIIEFSGK